MSTSLFNCCNTYWSLLIDLNTIIKVSTDILHQSFFYLYLFNLYRGDTILQSIKSYTAAEERCCLFKSLSIETLLINSLLKLARTSYMLSLNFILYKSEKKSEGFTDFANRRFVFN